MQANSVGTLNTPEEKLNWIFTAFDTDGGGSIDVDEIRDIVIGLFRLAGIEEDDDLVTVCVSDIRFCLFFQLQSFLLMFLIGMLLMKKEMVTLAKMNLSRML